MNPALLLMLIVFGPEVASLWHRLTGWNRSTPPKADAGVRGTPVPVDVLP
jgi:hypothetical protein